MALMNKQSNSIKKNYQSHLPSAPNTSKSTERISNFNVNQQSRISRRSNKELGN